MSEDFDPRAHMVDLKGKAYLQVKHRLIWLRRDHPDTCVTTEVVELTEDRAVFKAIVSYTDAGGEVVFGSGHGSETRQGFPPGWIEKAETIAIGRACAALGYGTDSAFEEGPKPADAPSSALDRRVRPPSDASQRATWDR